jgi:apolipoprotein D and lipocalin family protein
MKKFILFIFAVLLNTTLAHAEYFKTVDYVDTSRFFTKWYVIAGRLTSMEEGAHNATETYTWNAKKKRIDIDFKFRKDDFNGPIKSIPQKGWIHNETTNAHWKVQPFWPLKMDYLVIALDQDYEWTAIGVPNEDYLWIMATTPYMSDEQLSQIIQQLDDLGYSTRSVNRVPQKW